MNKYLLLFPLFAILFATSGLIVSAQESSDDAVVQKYSIQFPVAELGNCTSFSTCKAYCEDETHADACVAFAKKKGFYKEVQRPENGAVIQSARTELGCNSETTCKAICEQEANKDKCMAFAEKHKLGGPKGKPGDRQVLDKAKTILGCDSEASCKAICEQEANRDKCSEFAKQTGLGGGKRRVGPGGCESEESCRAYCETHADECGGQRPVNRESNLENDGPNGQQDREQFCKDNPDKCRLEGTPPINTEDFCRKNPEQCRQNRQPINSQISPRVSGLPGRQIRGPNEGSSGRFEAPQERINQEGQLRQEEQEKTEPTEKPEETEESVKPVLGAMVNQSLLDRLLNWLLRR